LSEEGDTGHGLCVGKGYHSIQGLCTSNKGGHVPEHPHCTGVSPGINLGACYPERDENEQTGAGSAAAEGIGLCTTGLKYPLGT